MAPTELPRRFIRSWAYATAGIAAVALSVNWVVDPFGMNRVISVPGLNQTKPAVGSRTRMTKPYDVIRLRPRTVLLGNSRIESGFDPSGPGLPESSRPVYNMGLGGSGLREQERNLQHALALGTVRTVLLGIDLYDFLTPRDPAAAVAPRRPDARREGRLLVDPGGMPTRGRRKYVMLDQIAAYFSFDAMLSSAVTLAAQRRRGTSDRTALGYNPNRDVSLVIAVEGQHSVVAQANRKLVSNLLTLNGARRELTGEGTRGFHILSAIIEVCRRAGVELHVFTPPYHAELLEIFDIMGLWSDLEAWKTMVVAMLQVEPWPSAVDPPRLWDFSVHSELAVEPVPAEGDRTTEMRWYWETGHYKSTLGAEVLRQMLAADGGALPGAALTPSNLMSHLEHARRLQSAFQETAGELRARLAATVETATEAQRRGK